MSQKSLLIIITLLIVFLALSTFLIRSKKIMVSPTSSDAARDATPSASFITYQDSTGFMFNYPDNISLSKSEIEDPTIYTDLSLYSKDVSGSINLSISDTKLKTVDDWILENKVVSTPPKPITLGTLNGMEITTSDHMYLVSIDQGILFLVSMPRLEEKFWTPVYAKIISDFSFVAPVNSVATASVEDTVFESEEVVK